MFFIKRLLFKILGLKGYLNVIKKLFFIAYNRGLLKHKQEYYCHYYVKKMVNKGDVVVDIGANLGYYSRIFAELAGPQGKVYAVEPVALFRDILGDTVKPFSNVTIYPYALGKDDGTTISMGLPATSKYLSHGRTQVMSAKSGKKYVYEFTAEMRHPAVLFGDLSRIDYIKCDIEGYETVVIPEMIDIIKKHLPVIQIETDGENRKQIIELLKPLGYKVYYVNINGLTLFDEYNAPAFTGDLIFICS